MNRAANHQLDLVCWPKTPIFCRLCPNANQMQSAILVHFFVVSTVMGGNVMGGNSTRGASDQNLCLATFSQQNENWGKFWPKAKLEVSQTFFRVLIIWSLVTNLKSKRCWNINPEHGAKFSVRVNLQIQHESFKSHSSRLTSAVPIWIKHRSPRSLPQQRLNRNSRNYSNRKETNHPGHIRHSMWFVYMSLFCVFGKAFALRTWQLSIFSFLRTWVWFLGVWILNISFDNSNTNVFESLRQLCSVYFVHLI